MLKPLQGQNQLWGDELTWALIRDENGPGQKFQYNQKQRMQRLAFMLKGVENRFMPPLQTWFQKSWKD